MAIDVNASSSLNPSSGSPVSNAVPVGIRPVAPPDFQRTSLSDLTAPLAIAPQPSTGVEVSPLVVPAGVIPGAFLAHPVHPVGWVPPVIPAGSAQFIINPPDINLLDLHLTTFDGAVTLATNLQPFDDHMADAQIQEANAYLAADDLSGMSLTVGDSVGQAATAATAFDSDPLTGPLSDYLNDTLGTGQIVSQAVESQESAGQPLTTLQGDQNPAPPPAAPDSVEQFIEEQPNWDLLTDQQQQDAIMDFCTYHPDASGCEAYRSG